ncbi:MAG TPA: phosphatase PAP2 family protein [Candidatus Dormibacteraeota bacterium]
MTVRRALGAVTAVTAVLFAIDTYFVLTQPLLPFDVPVELEVQSVQWGPLAYLMDATNFTAGVYQTLLGLVVCAVMFFFERRAGWLMLIGSGASLLDQLFKDTIGRHRPTPDLVHILTPANGYSYPSGHAVFFTWLAFMLAAALAPRLAPWLRGVVWGLAVCLVVVACLGRIWIGVHWPSDVLGGFLLGLGWSAFVLWLPERWLPSPDAVWSRWRDRNRPVATA